MTENLAGRGEGLAGRDTIDTLKNLYDTRGLSGAELLALQEAISALEAAPAGTAAKHELNQWDDLQCKNCGLGLGRWPSEPECTPAALATPSAQAPRPDCELLSSPNSVLAFDDELNPEQEEQCTAFSTTSAREQSAATASDGPCVGDDEEVNCCRKHRIAFSKDKCDICHLHALATRLAAGISREGATRSHGPTDVHAGTVGPPKTPCVCAEEYVGPQCVNYYRCDRR